MRPISTPRGARRALGYCRNASRERVELAPAVLSFACIGHFDPFHDGHRDGFWAQTLAWLRSARPRRVAERWAAGETVSPGPAKSGTRRQPLPTVEEVVGQ